MLLEPGAQLGAEGGFVGRVAQLHAQRLTQYIGPVETFWGPDLERWFGDSARLAEFGAVVAQEVDPLVYALERDGPDDGRRARAVPSGVRASRASRLGIGDPRRRAARAGRALLPAHARGRGRPRVSRHVHGGPDPRAPSARLGRAARALPAAVARDRLRPLPARGAVPHRGARRLGRGREPHARRAGRRRLAAARREVVLLGGGRRPVRRHRAA